MIESMMQRWRVEEDDLIGGWCVVVDQPGTPATGNPPLAEFVHREVAQHLADLHNDWLIPHNARELRRIASEIAEEFRLDD